MNRVEAEFDRFEAPRQSRSVNTKQVAFTVILLVADILLLVLVFAPAGVLFVGVRAFRRGFFCNDESLMLPYKDDTVTTAVLGVLCLVMPLVAFVLVECCYYLQMRHKAYLGADFTATDLGCFRVPTAVNNVLYSFSNLLGGLAVVLVLTEVGKVVVGRLRPHFFSICRPDWSHITCQELVSNTSGRQHEPYYRMVYVNNYTCLETQRMFRVFDASKSFPSGHASIIMFSMVFLALYVQYRIHWNKLYFLKLFLQTAFLLVGIYTGLSRISDHKHHWSDVLAGSALGVIVAFYIIFAVWRLPDKFWTLEQKLALHLLRKRGTEDHHGAVLHYDSDVELNTVYRDSVIIPPMMSRNANEILIKT